MAWSVIRKATQGDQERLGQRAMAFARRHSFPVESRDSAIQEVDWYVEPHSADDEGQRLERQYLRRLWLAVVRRCLGHSWAEGIAYGTVGFVVD